MKILVLNGPNINFLGIREKNIYGAESYASLCDKLKFLARELETEIEIYQSNHEGDLVDKIQAAYGNTDAIIINPAAYTHTSIAILDALKAVSIPAVEVHISEISVRESFRQISYAGMACEKAFIGLGTAGYLRALEYLVEKYGG